MQIEISNVDISFDQLKVYQDFSLSIDEGEFVCFLGKSGCGKTVLLNTILGNVKPTKGSVKINGEIVTRPSKKIGVAYQDFFILPWMTLRKNIDLGSTNKSNVEKYAEMMKISQYLDMLPKEVSIGTKQRASIARALSSDAKLILMDEPLCSVDAITGHQIRKDLKTFCADRTVVYITHDIHEALELSTRIVCFGRGGKVVLDKATSETSYDEVLQSIDQQ